MTIARLSRLEGVEHEPDCADQAKPLRLRGASTVWDQAARLEVSVARFSCASCSLDVEVSAQLDPR